MKYPDERVRHSDDVRVSNIDLKRIADSLEKIADNEIRFGVGMSEFVGAREDAGIEFSKNKLNVVN